MIKNCPRCKKSVENIRTGYLNLIHGPVEVCIDCFIEYHTKPFHLDYEKQKAEDKLREDKEEQRKMVREEVERAQRNNPTHTVYRDSDSSSMGVGLGLGFGLGLLI